MKANRWRSDFLSVWARTEKDTRLWNALARAWTKRPLSSQVKLYLFEKPEPEDEHDRDEFYGHTITWSDHSSFWQVKAPANQSYSAVLLNDLGKYIFNLPLEDTFLLPCLSL